MSDATDQLEGDWDGFMDSLLKHPPLSKGSVMQELDRQTRCDGPTERERVEIIGHDDPVRNSDLGWKP